mgnify:CR=1 FL=1
MKYTLDCDILDGLVFIDESYLSELNDADLLYAMDILLRLQQLPSVKQAYMLRFPGSFLSVRPTASAAPGQIRIDL